MNADAIYLKDRWQAQILEWDAKITRASAETFRRANSNQQFQLTSGLHQILVGLKAVLAALDQLEEVDILDLEQEIDNAFTDLEQEFHRRFSN